MRAAAPPADVAAALQGCPGALARDTLFTCRAVLAATSICPDLSGVLTATAPMPAELRAKSSGAGARRCTEIYGCTEAGTVALRQPAQTAHWRFLR